MHWRVLDSYVALGQYECLIQRGEGHDVPDVRELSSGPQVESRRLASFDGLNLRRTTRVEDEAYCLFGLFGINLPTLYGEGRNAFYRLQEEILRTSLDTSLFAWGPILTVSGFEDLRADAGPPITFNIHGYALAPSPRHFKGCHNVSFPGLDADSVSFLVMIVFVYGLNVL